MKKLVQWAFDTDEEVESLGWSGWLVVIGFFALMFLGGLG